MLITATRDTYLKKSTANAADLPKGKKVFVKKGKRYPVNEFLHKEGDHEFLKLEHEAGSWFIYAPHWKIDRPADEVLLNVPYLSQRDNTIRPSQTCNMTCAAMVIGFYFPEKLQGKRQLEDELTNKAVRRWGRESIYYHANIVKILAEYGVKSEFNTETSFEDIKDCLESGNPVIYSGKFTESGHIVVLTGFDEKGFFVNDPWGEWFDSGYQRKHGERLHYSYDLIERVSYGGDRHGWAHLCSLKNAPTPQNKPPDFESEDEKIDTGIIKKFEGFRKNAYICPAGVWTIGFGTTEYPDGTEVKAGDRCSKSQAEEFLKDHVEQTILPKLRRIPHWEEMNNGQKSALVSFAYNLGSSFYDAHGFDTITSALKEKHWDKVSAALKLYVRANGEILEGLVNRRNAEAKLWQQ